MEFTLHVNILNFIENKYLVVTLSTKIDGLTRTGKGGNEINLQIFFFTFCTIFELSVSNNIKYISLQYFHLSFPLDSTNSMRRGKKKYKCDKCSIMVTDLPRHMKLVHKWAPSKAREANKLFDNCTYHWKKGPPMRSKRKNEGNEESTVPKKPRKNDYHLKKHCPYPGCYSVVTRLPRHLRGVHKLKDHEYTFYINNACNFSKRADKEELKEVKAACRREKYVELFESENILPNFNEKDVNKNYVGPNKTIFEIIDMAASAKPIDLENCTPSNVTANISNEEIINNFVQYLISVDGGKLCDKKTAPQYGNMVKSIIKYFDGDMTQLCKRKSIRDKFLMIYCKEKSYAPLTIKKFLKALHHFYAFLIDEEVNTISLIPEDILKMKVG